MATPFVQGRLRNKQLVVKIESECAHCGRGLKIVLDSEMEIRSVSAGAEPMVFQPDVNWAQFDEPNIIHAY
jgi:hypothetical protein